MVRIAAIGMGGRLASMVVKMLQHKDVKLVAVADIDLPAVKDRMRKSDIPLAGVKFYDTADQLLQHSDQFDGVAIGTHCNLHTPLALKVTKTKLPLLLEKPVAIDWKQLNALRSAFKGREKQVVVSFPLRVTPLFRAAKQMIDDGRLGTINHIQAINNVNYGLGYYSSWYRSFKETGGMWLQKATHDFDYLCVLAGTKPTTIAAMHTQRIFGDDRPFDPKNFRTPENIVREKLPAKPKTYGQLKLDPPQVFAKDVKHQDAGSAMIMFDGGILASYDQNFVVRYHSRWRGAYVIGYLGSLTFCWPDQEIIYHTHHSNRMEKIKIIADDGHSGGDFVLIKNFIELIRGESESVADLTDGINSVSMCLAARESAQKQRFMKIKTFNRQWPKPYVQGRSLVEG